MLNKISAIIDSEWIRAFNKNFKYEYFITWR